MFVDRTEPNSHLPISTPMVLAVKTLKGEKLLHQVDSSVKGGYCLPIAESWIGNRIEKCPIMVCFDLVFRGAWHKLESTFLHQRKYGVNRNRPQAIE
jgi:hypothetical protein